MDGGMSIKDDRRGGWKMGYWDTSTKLSLGVCEELASCRMLSHRHYLYLTNGTRHVYYELHNSRKGKSQRDWMSERDTSSCQPWRMWRVSKMSDAQPSPLAVLNNKWNEKCYYGRHNNKEKKKLIKGTEWVSKILQRNSTAALSEELVRYQMLSSPHYVTCIWQMEQEMPITDATKAERKHASLGEWETRYCNKNLTSTSARHQSAVESPPPRNTD